MNNRHLWDNYDHLTPDTVINAVESLGFLSDARVFPLNSYENRVYQVGVEDADPVIVKFYRPLRWSDEAIREAHQYSQDLADLELPAVAPFKNKEGDTLNYFEGYRFAAFRRQGGQAPEQDDFDQLLWPGRLLGRMHQAGGTTQFSARPTLSVQRMVTEPSEYLLQHNFIPSHQVTLYEGLIEGFTQNFQALFNDINPQLIRCHGDCHIANILWHRETGPWFVDFDDCQNAPAVQDLWMLLAGTRQEQVAQFSELLEGYEEFTDFDRRQLRLIEPLRTMRMIYYAGWLARRWTDPAFPANFPWFNTSHYWQNHIGSLQEQQLILEGEPFTLF
ncbi:MAG: serine/threonine protein kinase [Pseudomonadales bacterium]|nr:serine/threonine protein kinase [Pseudomonadales bacterium]